MSKKGSADVEAKSTARRTESQETAPRLEPEPPTAAFTRARSAPRGAMRAEDVLTLQRAVGNRAVQRMLAERSPPAPAPVNRTGLPDSLKARTEQLSGLSLDDVKVHYNSAAPAQVGALTYARGSEIHVGPGQEKHLAHETWHVVQQKQGRVTPTTVVNGHPVNDDPSLEADADHHGAKLSHEGAGPAVQRKASAAVGAPVIQRRIKEVTDSGKTGHVAWGNAFNNSLPVTEEKGDRPVLIEVMEGNLASVQAKVQQLANSKGDLPDNRALMVAYNKKADANKYDSKTGMLEDSKIPPKVVDDARELATTMEQQNVRGGCFPMIWSPTDLKVKKGYTFPFLEARARVTLHKGTEAMVKELMEFGRSPIMRSMDADVSNDPLLTGNLDEQSLAHLNDLGSVAYDEYAGPTSKKKKGAAGPRVVSGGYNWDPAPKDADFWLDDTKKKLDTQTQAALDSWNKKWKESLEAINDIEHQVRVRLSTQYAQLIYWPEPNSYMAYDDRKKGAQTALEAGSGQGTQQGEMTYYVKGIKEQEGKYIPTAVTTKPVKDYFNSLRDLIKQSDKAAPSDDEIKKFIIGIRQTHLKLQTLKDVLKWHDDKQKVMETREEEITKLLDSAIKKLFGQLKQILGSQV